MAAFTVQSSDDYQYGIQDSAGFRRSTAGIVLGIDGRPDGNYPSQTHMHAQISHVEGAVVWQGPRFSGSMLVPIGFSLMMYRFAAPDWQYPMAQGGGVQGVGFGVCRVQEFRVWAGI